MRIDTEKLELAMARACKAKKDLADSGVPYSTLHRAYKGTNVTPATVGVIAKALGVDPAEIIKKD